MAKSLFEDFVEGTEKPASGSGTLRSAWLIVLHLICLPRAFGPQQSEALWCWAVHKVISSSHSLYPVTCGPSCKLWVLIPEVLMDLPSYEGFRHQPTWEPTSTNLRPTPSLPLNNLKYGPQTPHKRKDLTKPDFWYPPSSGPWNQIVRCFVDVAFWAPSKSHDPPASTMYSAPICRRNLDANLSPRLPHLVLGGHGAGCPCRDPVTATGRHATYNNWEVTILSDSERTPKSLCN